MNARIVLGSLLVQCACSSETAVTSDSAPPADVSTVDSAVATVDHQDPDLALGLDLTERDEPAPEELQRVDSGVDDTEQAPDLAAVLDAPMDLAADEPEVRRDPPPFPRYSRGTCPRLIGGPTADSSVNSGFQTGSQRRSFRLIVPPSYDGSSDWPLMFAWHWLNASSRSFVNTGELNTATEQMHFIAVAPDRLENGSGTRAYLFDWPFAEVWGAESELGFFDDLLACVSSQYRIDRRRVYAVGVSAGALWVTYLSTTTRANHLAAVESLSGGLGDELGIWRMEWHPQPNKFPAIVLWGGPSDWLGLSFQDASLRYRNELVHDHHFVIQCVHSMGHMVPPIDRPPDGGTRFRPLWQFFLDHPYGSAPGSSPYLSSGLPPGMPSWCNIVR